MAKGDKVKKIIREEFDERMNLMVLTYLLSQLGMDQAASITDDDIAKMEGNALMTEGFVQSLVRTARRIAKECSFVDDIIPYIVTEFDYLAKEAE